MPFKSDFGRLFDHLKTHKDEYTATAAAAAAAVGTQPAGSTEKRSAPADVTAPPAQKRPTQRTIVDMIAGCSGSSAPPPPPAQQRF